MTKQEVKEFLEKLGLKVTEITDDLVAKVEAQKALMDTETRRKTRLFWAFVSVVTFGLGILVGKVF